MVVQIEPKAFELRFIYHVWRQSLIWLWAELVLCISSFGSKFTIGKLQDSAENLKWDTLYSSLNVKGQADLWE